MHAAGLIAAQIWTQFGSGVALGEAVEAGVALTDAEADALAAAVADAVAVRVALADAERVGDAVAVGVGVQKEAQAVVEQSQLMGQLPTPQ